MSRGVPRVIGIGLGLIILGAVFTAVAPANPKDYPEYAQQKIKDDIPIAFIKVEAVKQRLDNGTTQFIVDVRNRSDYDKTHLPNARSIPLRELPHRLAEIPRDIPVVLY